MYAPGDVLLYTTYPSNLLGQIKPGSGSADKIVDLTVAGVHGSTGGVALTPNGFPNAGSLKFTSYSADSWFDADLVPDGGGTFDVTNVVFNVFLPAQPGPESIEHVDTSYPGFDVPSVLIAGWTDEDISAYELDANGDPIKNKRRDFLECCDIFYMGSTTDPLTGDFLFADWGSGDQIIVVRTAKSDIGTNYCGPANLNSTGQGAVIAAEGNLDPALNLLSLLATQLPPNVPGYFLNSDMQGFVPFPGGSQGNLCLSGGIGRHAKQIANSNAAGELSIDVDLTMLPRPNGTHAVLAGETWNFQCWFRDKNPNITSNFSDGIEILFQ
jgi:hypothetical protein